MNLSYISDPTDHEKQEKFLSFSLSFWLDVYTMLLCIKQFKDSDLFNIVFFAWDEINDQRTTNDNVC